MNIWDQNFAGPEFRYGIEPNAFLSEQAWRLSAPSRVLVPGDGEGRNGVWLARQGHEVLSVDMSSVGVNKALRLAQSHGVSLQTQVADLADWQPEPGAFDAVVLMYVHLPAGIRQSVHQRLMRGLRPGGWLIVEGFHTAQLRFESGGPKDVPMLFTLDMLREDFQGMTAEALAWDGVVILNEGPGHQGPGHVLRYVAQR